MADADVRLPRWAAKYPHLGQEPLPVDPYISPEWYQAEKEKIFKKTWLYVGRVEEIAKKGDYKVRRLTAADTSVIIVRGKDDVIRGFHNACSHRGNTVVSEMGEETYGNSKAAVMTCRFHGWVYNAEGNLVNVPQEDRFYSCFDKSKNGLAPVHCDVWRGFIFVNVDPGPVQPLLEFLGGFADHFSDYPYEQMAYGFTYHTMLDCNWKIASDAFAEAYHVDTIHAGSFPNVFSNGIEGVEIFGPHRTCGVHLNLGQLPQVPIGMLAGRKARGSLTTQAGTSMIPPTMNRDRRSDFAFELSVLFPSVLLHVSEGIWFTHQFWPIAHDKTLWEGKYYLAAPRTHSELWGFNHAMILQRNAWLEDTATMEDTHRAMASGVKKFQNLQDEEILIRHGFKVVEDYVNS
jgi:phenylpropionate dioxygenase-like ring-hydroxylating dioxygenase large terminal subunit